MKWRASAPVQGWPHTSRRTAASGSSGSLCSQAHSRRSGWRSAAWHQSQRPALCAPPRVRVSSVRGRHAHYRQVRQAAERVGEGAHEVVSEQGPVRPASGVSNAERPPPAAQRSACAQLIQPPEVAVHPVEGTVVGGRAWRPASPAGRDRQQGAERPFGKKHARRKGTRTSCGCSPAGVGDPPRPACGIEQVTQSGARSWVVGAVRRQQAGERRRGRRRRRRRRRRRQGRRWQQRRRRGRRLRRRRAARAVAGGSAKAGA